MLSDNNSDIYKNLYSEKRIDKILSDASFVNKILLFEKMLLKANYQLKNIPHKAYIVSSLNFLLSKKCFVVLINTLTSKIRRARKSESKR